MTKLSVAIITFNEEKNISDCLDSVVDLADEIIVLDSFSTDKTEEFARKYKLVKFSTHPFHGHVEQKNKALELCQHEWVLSLDADERIDPVLKQAILDWKKSNDAESIDGFKMSRLTWHMGRFIRHSGWYPNRKYRLFKKSKAVWIGENPHDEISINGRGGVLPGNILHYSFPDYSAQVDTVNKFSSIVSYTRHKKGRKFSFFMCIVKPFFKFWEVYLFRGGFLDGFPGFAIACATSFSTYLKFAKIYELDRKIIQRPSNLRKTYGEVSSVNSQKNLPKKVRKREGSS